MMGNIVQRSKAYLREVSVNTDKPALPANFTFFAFITAFYAMHLGF
jgi:hypothetical protein